MNYYISFAIINFVIDFVIVFLVNSFCKLYVKKINLVTAMIFVCVPTVVYSLYKVDYPIFIFYKIVAYCMISIILTDKMIISKIAYIFSMIIFMFFSVYGFAEFFIKFSEIVIFKIFGLKIDIIYHFIIILALLLYLLILILFFSSMSKKQNINNFLYNVSFFLFGKHIQISGLLDSGNSLYDTKTGKAVIIVSLSAIKKFISISDYKKLVSNNFNNKLIVNKIDCRTVGEKKVTLPIIDIGEVKIENFDEGTARTVKCVIGLTNEEFLEKNDYECLLHREFI